MRARIVHGVPAVAFALGLSLAAVGPAYADDAPPATPAPAEASVVADESDLQPEPEFEIHGFLQNQTGLFVSPDHDETTVYHDYPGDPGVTFPSNHGDKLGTLSMLRNTLQLEMDWRPSRIVQLHAMLRGVLSAPLTADRDAQVPDPGYLTDPGRRRQWVMENFYQEASIRELYLDITPHPQVSFRIGRQLVAWGEAGSARLLDVVNPVNSSWHFGAFENFEDQRIPLWLVKALFEIPELRGGLEVVWVPMVPGIERPSDTVTTPLTFVGAWGLPQPDRQGDVSVMPQKIHEKHFLYPDQNPKESRVGVRWKGEAGPLTYTLMYYWGHQVSPPIPEYYQTNPAVRGVDVFVDFPRQHIAGLSLEYNAPFPVSTMLKLEAVVEPDRVYPVHSLAPRPEDTPLQPDGSTRFYFSQIRKPTVTYAVTIQQPALVRWLNPEDTLVLALQFQHSFLPTFDKDDLLLSIPGYDSTLLLKHQFQLGGALFTSYLHGMITPKISGAWLFGQQGYKNNGDGTFSDVGFRNGGGLLSVSCAFAFGTHWRVNVALNELFGDDPYYGVGMFRDRDEVNVAVRYQF